MLADGEEEGRRVEDEDTPVAASVAWSAARAGDRDGLVFSLLVSCDDGAVSDESAASIGSDEGSGARKRGDGGLAMG